MSTKRQALKGIETKPKSLKNGADQKNFAFGQRVFHRGLIEKLPKDAAHNWLGVLDGREVLDPRQADVIAAALKNWAISHGSTHFTHWFQPLTHAGAEKHDSFLNWAPDGSIIQNFRGKDLLSGEPDASSFPSGGLRITHEARGYTIWDPTSYPFLWESAEGLTLCIPSLFFSFKGEPLDHKLPLLRSEEKMNQAVLKLLHLAHTPAKRAYSTLGIEQEYFLIDRELFYLREDLFLTGRTLFGAKPPKGQELEDHYFSAIKERTIAYMREFEEAALKLGIPLKTRHNEVAPAQHEVAPLFERASLAIDHNVLLMELMRSLAEKHELACLFHEKPFNGINGSGKHNNWSIATDTGLNLLDPEGDPFLFFTTLTAVIKAVHEHAALLRATIGSAGNDHRLGGSEAPPTILSIYLGEVLEQEVLSLIEGKQIERKARKIDLKLPFLPHHLADLSDRNRTSFFAFTGNKFEFRAVGASAHSAHPICVMNAIFADSLELIVSEMRPLLERVEEPKMLFQAALPILKKHLKAALPILFGGDNYSAKWQEEAAQRSLPNIRKSVHAFAELKTKKCHKVFDQILTPEELESRYEIMVEQYVKTLTIEAKVMIEMFQTQILPASQKDMVQRKMDEPLLNEAALSCKELKKMLSQIDSLGWEARGRAFVDLLIPKMEELRNLVDQIEMIVDHALWPLPKYRELLYLV